jgi:hypothetical protein
MTRRQGELSFSSGTVDESRTSALRAAEGVVSKLLRNNSLRVMGTVCSGQNELRLLQPTARRPAWQSAIAVASSVRRLKEWKANLLWRMARSGTRHVSCR